MVCPRLLTRLYFWQDALRSSGISGIRTGDLTSLVFSFGILVHHAHVENGVGIIWMASSRFEEALLAALFKSGQAALLS